MGIIHEIQDQLVTEGAPLGPVLMKLRLLAAKLGSLELEEWIKQEAEGYPSKNSVPDYRKLGMSFLGTFFGPDGRGLQNAPIPSYLIGEIAGENWTHFHICDSASAIDALVAKREGLHLDLSNLMLLIRGEIYADYDPIELKGFVSPNALIEVSNTIRNKILEFTIELEKLDPSVTTLELRKITRQPELATKVFNSIVNKNITNIHHSGDNVSIEMKFAAGDVDRMKEILVKAGLKIESAEEISAIVASEKPDQVSSNGLGARARAWLADRITRGADEGIEGGIATLSRVIRDAALSYYGLK